MPLYDLRCIACGLEFNVLASLADREGRRIACPDCGAADMQPVFKAMHFQIKKEAAPACPHSQTCGGCQLH